MVAVILFSLAALVVLSAVLYLRHQGKLVQRHGVRPVHGAGSDGVHPGPYAGFDADGGDGGGGGGGGGGD